MRALKNVCNSCWKLKKSVRIDVLFVAPYLLKSVRILAAPYLQSGLRLAPPRSHSPDAHARYQSWWLTSSCRTLYFFVVVVLILTSSCRTLYFVVKTFLICCPGPCTCTPLYRSEYTLPKHKIKICHSQQFMWRDFLINSSKRGFRIMSSSDTRETTGSLWDISHTLFFPTYCKHGVRGGFRKKNPKVWSFKNWILLRELVLREQLAVLIKICQKISAN